jgi:hypothetical protein
MNLGGSTAEFILMSSVYGMPFNGEYYSKFLATYRW